MANFVHQCWVAQQQLLLKEGLIEEHLQQTWSAVCSSIISSLKQGRGCKIPGLCTILPSTSTSDSQAGQPCMKVLLSEQLLKVAPQLQLGRGCAHHASVKQQVQGVDTLNTAKLTYRFAQGLSQDAIKLAVRVLTDTAGKQLKLRQACTVDLGVGQLRFAAGAGLAEFTPRSGWQRQQPQAPPRVPPLNSSTDAVSKPQGSLAHSGAASHCSNNSSHQHSSISASAAQQTLHSSKSPANAPCKAEAVGRAARPAAPRPPAATAGPSTAAVPEKPSNCDYDPAAAWEIAREVRTAAAQNARVKPAAFVLPAGGPCEEGDQPRMPQGKGKYAAPTLSQQQVMAAAALRLQHEAAERAAQEASTLKLQASRMSALNLQAQARAQQKRTQKQQLAADLAQQVQDKARRAQPGHLNGLLEQALIVSSKPDPAVVKVQKRQQQAEYRAFLDTQAAAKGRQQHCDQLEQQEVRQQQKQLVQNALGAADDPRADS